MHTEIYISSRFYHLDSGRLKTVTLNMVGLMHWIESPIFPKNEEIEENFLLKTHFYLNVSFISCHPIIEHMSVRNCYIDVVSNRPDQSSQFRDASESPHDTNQSSSLENLKSELFRISQNIINIY